MKRFRRLLVDVDALAAVHPALEQALDLAERCRARVRIVDVLPDVPHGARRFVTRVVERELVEDRRSRLAAIAHGHTQGVPRSTSVLRGKPATALIDEVRRGKHDLLVRSHQRDLDPEPRPFGPIDMRLLRLCPCPVWLIGPLRFEAPVRIVACVDVGAPDPEHQALNDVITETALMLREVTDGTLTLLHAWAPFGESLLESRLSAAELGELTATTRRTAADGMSAFLRRLGPRGTGLRVELLKGEPEDVIPGFARGDKADVVVMGTVARAGLSGALIGNTAERVLRRLHGSVLAIKPPGFVSPIVRPRHAAARRRRRTRSG